MEGLQPDRREKFFKAGNYVLYYGMGREQELSSFDIVIVEPSGQNIEGLNRMHESGTTVIAYLSVMEINTISPYFKLLKEEDFLKIDNKPAMNSTFGTYLLDLQSKRWNDLIFHHAEKLIFNQGYDGIFLDTVADVEHQYIPQGIRRLQLLSAINIIKKLRDIFSKHIIIQNNGIEELCMHTSEFIDGICLENPFYLNKNNPRWTRDIIKRLKMLSSDKKLKIFFLLEGKELRNNKTKEEVRGYLDKIHDIAMRNDILLYAAQNSYVDF